MCVEEMGDPFPRTGSVRPSEDTILLREFQHRVANELAAAEAAMRLVSAAGRPLGRRGELLDRALERLQGFGQVHRVLAAQPSKVEDVSAGLHAICRGLIAGRPGLERAQIHTSMPPLYIAGHVAQRLHLIAAELVLNALKYALTDRAGTLHVNVYAFESTVTLMVADDGPGLEAAPAIPGTGLGSGIIRSLVDAAAGRLEFEASKIGTVMRVTLPIPDGYREG